MSDLTPVSITPVEIIPTPVQRKMNLSGTPMPEDIRSVITDHFDVMPDEEDLDIVYQYILHKSEEGTIEDIKTTLEALASNLQPNKQELFAKIKDIAIRDLSLANPMEKVEAKIDIVRKELPLLEAQAEKTGDWRFYLRASSKLEELNAISSIS